MRLPVVFVMVFPLVHNNIASTILIDTADAAVVNIAAIDVNNHREDSIWKRNLMRGYAEAVIPLTVDKDGMQTNRIHLMDVGLAISRIDISSD